MTTDTNRTSVAALRGQQAAKPATGMREIVAMPKQQQFPKMLEAFRKEIAIALPAHMNADRMARIALTCFRQNPTLAECEPQSVFACVVMASQLGLEPGLMGQAYLIPFNKKVKRQVTRGDRTVEVEEWVKECQLIPGYQGLVDLARRSGRIKSLEAHVVYEHDTFECSFGLNPTLHHEPRWDGDRGQMRLAYAVANLSDGGVHVEVMSRSQIHAIRDRSQNVINAKKYRKTTPWDTDEEQMWIKTVLRRICKFLPKSVELASAIALDALNARGRAQELDLADAIDGEYSNVAALEDFTDQGDDTGDDAGDAEAPSPDGTVAPAAENPSPAAAGATASVSRRRGGGDDAGAQDALV